MVAQFYQTESTQSTTQKETLYHMGSKWSQITWHVLCNLAIGTRHICHLNKSILLPVDLPKIAGLEFSGCIDPDQGMDFVASDLGLHCFCMSVCLNTSSK